MNNFIHQQNDSLNTNDSSNTNNAHDKKVFIAYFDILGFKNYVMNHDLNELVKMMDNFVRDSQSSTTDRNKFSSHGCESDMSTSKVNAMHISDSLIYWTHGNSIEDFENILDASRKLFMITNTTRVPLRGCITYGELYFTPDIISENSNKFYQFSMYGKSIVNAYTKAESLKIVGCVIDDYVNRHFINDLGICNGLEEYFKTGKIVYRSIPQKEENGVSVKPEIVIKPFRHNEALSELDFYNKCTDLKTAFCIMSDNKVSACKNCSAMKFYNDMNTEKIETPCKKDLSIESLPEDVKQKFYNTVEFYRSFLNPDKSCSK